MTDGREEHVVEILVLGSGCRNCDRLEAAAKEAVARLGIDATVEHVRDFDRIMAFGVMSTPALVVDGTVRVAGRVPSVDDLERLLASPEPGA